MKNLRFVHTDNFRYLTGLRKDFAQVADSVLSEIDVDTGGAISELMRANKTTTEVHMAPGCVCVQSNTASGRYGVHFQKFDGDEYSEKLSLGLDRYGESSPFAFMADLTDGVRHHTITVPLSTILATAKAMDGSYQVYSHSFCADERGSPLGQELSYIGLTKRGWQSRYREHVRAASGGSHYKFHEAIRTWSDRASITAHTVIACGLTEQDAMDWEERLVGMETLFPNGLNMIPGGYAGIRRLHSLGAIAKGERVTPDDKADIINRFYERMTRRGIPNPEAAANWLDPDYAASVICGAPNRLTLNQVREARALSDLGEKPETIARFVGARSVTQVQRLLDGVTYSRVA